jgi:hypothetical protein
MFTNTSNETKYYKVTRTIDDSTYVTSIGISVVDSQNIQPDEYTVQYGTKYYRGTASEYPRIVFSGQKQGVVIEYTKADDLTTVKDIVENVETRNLGCDVHCKLPYQVDIYITNLTYLPNSNSPVDNVPENLIKSSLADFISKSNSVLSKIDITSYLINNFYQFITTLTSEMSITYVLRGVDNFDIPYTATKEVSIEQISNQLSVENSFDSSSALVSLDTLLANGVSDRTIKYYCSADYIDMRSSV